MIRKRKEKKTTRGYLFGGMHWGGYKYDLDILRLTSVLYVEFLINFIVIVHPKSRRFKSKTETLADSFLRQKFYISTLSKIEFIYITTTSKFY